MAKRRPRNKKEAARVKYAKAVYGRRPARGPGVAKSTGPDYGVSDNPMAALARNPRRPVRVKVNGKTYPAKARMVNGKVKIFVTPAVAAKANPELKEYKVVFFSKSAAKNVTHPVYATTAGGASRLARKQKKELFPDARNWKVLSVGRVSR